MSQRGCHRAKEKSAPTGTAAPHRTEKVGPSEPTHLAVPPPLPGGGDPSARHLRQLPTGVAWVPWVPPVHCRLR